MGSDRLNPYKNRFSGNTDRIFIQTNTQIFRGISFPAAFHHFLREDLHNLPDPLALVAQGCFFSYGNQLPAAGLLFRFRQLSGHICSRRIGAGRLGENVDPGKAHLPDHFRSFLKFFLCFPGKPGQNIRR